jgi:hypothetical protein
MKLRIRSQNKPPLFQIRPLGVETGQYPAVTVIRDGNASGFLEEAQSEVGTRKRGPLNDVSWGLLFRFALSALSILCSKERRSWMPTLDDLYGKTNKAQYYRLRAAECYRVAIETRNKDREHQFLDLARQWEDLARLADSPVWRD